jgi:hypothetical protein
LPLTFILTPSQGAVTSQEEKRLATEPEALDQGAIALMINPTEIVEEATSPPHHPQEPTP